MQNYRRKPSIYSIYIVLLLIGIVATSIFYTMAGNVAAVAPMVGPVTFFLLLGLFYCEYKYIEERRIRRSLPITKRWRLLSITALAISAIPQLAILFISAFLWILVIPILVFAALLLLYMLVTKPNIGTK